ncbi:F-box/LRR-repeat/kelch-repeat protein [Cardamine amara subsp. amara]|uniref:F-box/LRR-repeat/kelch-repeat protein n=1 Tax=Cardamine amara subsp. amara TaxID=228776 RepID=A0ABD0ZYN2_CARAN
MSKKQRCLRMESLLRHDVVECILERVPAKSLLRFKAVSKQWKTTIESRLFQEKQFRNRQESGDPDVLMVSVLKYEDGSDEPDIEALRTLVLGSSSSVKIPTCWEDTYYFVCPSSCDGLVCLYFGGHITLFVYQNVLPVLVVNPTTRWHRPLPICKFQQHIIHLGEQSYLDNGYAFFRLDFGKDKFTGTCKPVWLYNSYEVGLENHTTCEVFDFSTNAWRYVTPTAPYRIIGGESAYVDGSLYWFTDCEETKVVSLDLHTEAFQVISKPPFAFTNSFNEFVMCNLDNRLCVSKMNWPNQVIWSFHSGNKTWDKLYSIDLVQTLSMFDLPKIVAFMPLAVLDGDNNNN